LNNILNMEGLEPLANGTTETDDAIAIAVARRGRSRDWCPHCGAQSLAPNGTRRVSIADLPIRGKPVTLEWDRQRFKCREDRCGKTCSDHHPGLHDAFEMTRRLYDWIGNRCMNVTFTSVASDTSMDERTVRRVFEHWSDHRISNLEIATPKWLGIDEVHLLRSARGVLTNIDQKALIDLLPNRNQETMARRIQKMPDRDRVQVVAMDMWLPYRRIAESLLPRAAVIVDKWHVTKYADAGMETIRKGYKADLTTAMRRRLVKDRFLLLKRGRNLSPEQRLIMQTWTHHFPELAAAYEAKEAFYDVYDSPDRRTAETRFDAWEQSLTPTMRTAFKDLLSATRNWREPIFNYFDHRVTNAYTEAINGLVKITNRNGRGYSFDVLRAKMLLSREAVKRDAPKRVAESDRHVDGFMMYKRAPSASAAMPKHYGSDIATLTRLIEGGHLLTPPTEFAE
jgi:transposase